MANDTNIKCGKFYEPEKFAHLEKIVNKIINANPKDDLFELRKKIYTLSGVGELLKNFFISKKKASGGVIELSTPYFNECFYVGNKQEGFINDKGIWTPNHIATNQDTIFDLASVTKLFTAVAILQLVEDGTLKLSDPVAKHDDRFVNLGHLTIEDLLMYAIIQTNERVDNANTVEEAENILFNATHKAWQTNMDRYNDFAPIVLKYIVEKKTGYDFYTYIEKNILKPLKMWDTYVSIPNEERDRVAHTGHIGTLDKNGILTFREVKPGISSDKKAEALGQPEGKLPGHAGLFSTSGDLTRFSKGLIDNTILSKNMVDALGTQKVGELYKKEDTKALWGTQTFSYLAYVVNQIKERTEVPYAACNKSFAIEGWTGTQLTTDPINAISVAFLSNRTHNRMIFIDGTHKVTKVNDSSIIILPNGTEMKDSSKFAFHKDEIISKVYELALMYRMLEEKKEVKKDKNKIKVKEYTRKI